MTSYAVTGQANKLKEDDFFTIADVIEKLPGGVTLYSGGAHGVDTAAAMIALKREDIDVILVVPIDQFYNYRLARDAGLTQVIEVEGSYMNRNSALAEIADELIAFPRTAREILRSGTWSTIRRFRKLEKPVHLHPLQEGART